VIGVALVAQDAEAGRLGGGKSFGRQSPNATRQGSPPSRDTGQSTQPPGQPPAAGQPPVQQPRNRWLGPIAGIAAGLGLAALFSHLGLSESLGSLLLIGFLVVGAIVLVRLFMARRAAGNAYQYANAGSTDYRAPIDAAGEPAVGPGWGPTASAAGRFPPGFEPAPFVDQAKQQFRRLQAAYDRGDRSFLAEVTTPEMHAEITHDIAARGAHQPTEIVALDADVVEVMREGDQYVASVRFHGSLREDGTAQPQPFEEMWNLVKPVDGSSGWLLAGIQQYA